VLIVHKKYKVIRLSVTSADGAHVKQLECRNGKMKILRKVMK
jgi:hypothetical protein